MDDNYMPDKSKYALKYLFNGPTRKKYSKVNAIYLYIIVCSKKILFTILLF